MERGQTSESLIEQYLPFEGYFVFVERKNKKRVNGILEKFTPDDKLCIKGKYMSWIIKPSEIDYFSARPDKFKFEKKGGTENNRE